MPEVSCKAVAVQNSSQWPCSLCPIPQLRLVGVRASYIYFSNISWTTSVLDPITNPYLGPPLAVPLLYITSDLAIVDAEFSSLVSAGLWSQSSPISHAGAVTRGSCLPVKSWVEVTPIPWLKARPQLFNISMKPVKSNKYVK